MTRLGISIYPEHSNAQRDKEYIKLAYDNGFRSIFTCLLSAEGDVENLKAQFQDINGYAASLGMDVIFDVAPSVFKKLNISYNDLSFFKECYASGIRLDEGFDGMSEAIMSYNKEQLKLVINASIKTKYLDNILSYQANKTNIEACHNFYPQKYTGLSSEHFNSCNDDLKQLNIPISAFISSQNTNTFGPWPLYEGLCTLEEHRSLPLDLQARHLAATKMIDGIYIGNAYATKAELETISKINFAKLTFKITLNPHNTSVENEIIFNYPHYVRGDMSGYMARSTMCRIDYKDSEIKPHDTRDLKCGDIIIINENYGRYKGELHIVLKDMPNEGNKNVVGHLSSDEMVLLNYIEPWRHFAFIK